MTNQPLPAVQPPLILIIPQSALEKMPAAAVAGITSGCESVYKSGTYYVTVPAEVYSQWPRKEPVS